MSNEKEIKAGDLYKVITVAGHDFEIRYMDCGEFDSDQKGKMIPDFPYFDEKMEYTDDGFPFTNKLNDDCRWYKSKAPKPDGTCSDCIYFKDAVEEIGVCRCTARRMRDDKSALTGKTIRVAVIGNLPTSEIVLKEAYANIQIDRYYRATDMPFAIPEYHLILCESYVGEGLGLMNLTATYKTENGQKVSVPVRILAEPPCMSAESELAVLIKCTIAKKVNS